MISRTGPFKVSQVEYIDSSRNKGDREWGNQSMKFKKSTCNISANTVQDNMEAAVISRNVPFKASVVWIHWEFKEQG